MNVLSGERKKVIIVGGGTAGWMTANIFAFVWQREPIDICVVESDKIESIGVGEGSTPALKGFFDHIGIPESIWMPRCNATYKCGIEFRGWSSQPDSSRYFHPFPTYFDRQTSSMYLRDIENYRRGEGARFEADHYFLSAYLASRGLSPIGFDIPEKAVSYGYHFDAALLGRFLSENASKLGVELVKDTVDSVELNSRGDIKSLRLGGGRVESADFYVDCTGFCGLLIREALGTPWVSCQDILLNDSAVAIPTPREEYISPKTVSSALKYGWAWHIPLKNRVGNGYVYSSRYCSAEDAESELRSHLGLSDPAIPARHIKMKVGRVSVPWNKNCLAIGLSQGFLEPLEATSLLVSQQIASIFANNVRKGGLSFEGREVFNQYVNELFDGIRDYIVAHYKTNSVEQSGYWMDARVHSKPVSEGLQSVLASWHSGNLLETLKGRRLERFYSAPSWYCLLAGVGFFDGVPNDGMSGSKVAPDMAAITLAYDDLCKRFIGHEEQLRRLSHK